MHDMAVILLKVALDTITHTIWEIKFVNNKKLLAFYVINLPSKFESSYLWSVSNVLDAEPVALLLLFVLECWIFTGKHKIDWASIFLL